MQAHNAVYPACATPPISQNDYAVLPVEYNPSPFDKVVDQLYMMDGFHTVPLGEAGNAHWRFRWFGNPVQGASILNIGDNVQDSTVCGCKSCDPRVCCLQCVLSVLCPCCRSSFER